MNWMPDLIKFRYSSVGFGVSKKNIAAPKAKIRPVVIISIINSKISLVILFSEARWRSQRVSRREM